MCKGVDDGFAWGEGNKDRITYYTCGHSSEGGLINLDEENQTAILEMIEKGVASASVGVCLECSKKEAETKRYNIYPIARGERM